MPNRRSMLIALAAAVLAAIVVGGAFGVRLGDDPDGTSAPTADASADHDAPTGSLSGRTEPRAGTKQRGSESLPEPTSSTSPQTPQAPTTPTTPTTAKGGVAVVPEQAGPAGEYRLPGLGRPATDPSGPAYEPPEKPAAARGRLVAGYPARLLPRAPRSTVVSSSVAPTTGRVQVALVGHRSTSPSSVLLFYRATLGRSGFREVPTQAVGGADAAAFRRGDERVVVTIDPAPARTYSVYATLVAGEA